MQHEDPSTHGSAGRFARSFFSAPTHTQTTIPDFASPLSYSSIFFTPTSTDMPSSSPLEPSSVSGSMRLTPPHSTGSSLGTNADLSFLMREHQDLLNRHKNCLTNLHKTFNEAETLRQENTNLRVANRNLSERLNLLIQATLQSHYAATAAAASTLPSSSSSSSAAAKASSSSLSTELYASSGGNTTSPTIPPPVTSLSEKFGGVRVSERSGRERGGSWDGADSPTSVIETDRVEQDVNRVTLPKSISVRSNGYLKGQANPTGSSNGGSGPIRPASRTRSVMSADGPQKVYVRGGKAGSQKDGPIELEVYNQGMFKTELCNKWQETGSCPYGEHCQFAHGIGELRPVLRHPRYKTEVCRMVLAGDPCPYGHRCHFRHALTEQEKLMVPLKLD